MSTYNTTTNIQEAAAEFANNIAAEMNSNIAEVAGIDVMWFRATPDKRNQDVIFQSYTLWGVEDCPLSFKALYSDTGYDNAMLMANIMGIEYQVPLTLEIAVNTWYTATNQDGTLPQKGDIVFIPMTAKLLEVVSMTPVKAIAGQLTSFKVNCAIYKPNRSRIVGENLKTSIDNNTTNLDKAFGDAIDNAVKNIVDDKELSLFSSTSRDKYKELTNTYNTDTLENVVIQTKIEDLIVDGHTVAHSCYDMNMKAKTVVRYKNINDTVNKGDMRCLTCWIFLEGEKKMYNIKTIAVLENNSDRNYSYIQISGNKTFPIGSQVIVERNTVVIPGTVTIKADKSLIRNLEKNTSVWKNLPGYTIREDDSINLLSGTTSDNKNMSIDVKGKRHVSFSLDSQEILYQFNTSLSSNKWYGIVLNLGENSSLDIYQAEPKFERIVSLKGKNNLLENNTFIDYHIDSSESKMTNIRYYTQALTDIDKQITDLLTYNIPYDSLAIINDSADIYLHKNYFGIQR